MFGRNKRKKNRFKKNRRVGTNKLERQKLNFLQNFHSLPNISLIAIVTLLFTGGILMVFSASVYYASTDPDTNFDSFFYFKRQLLYILLGIIGGYIAYIVPIEWFRKFSPIILAIGIVLLLYILPEALFGSTDTDGNTSGLQMPFVEAINGAPRWINLQVFNFQPSEYVKFAFVIYISAWLTKNRNNTTKKTKELREHITNVVLPFILLLGFVSLLILLQRDFDTTVVLALTILTVYFVSGTDFIHTMGSIFITMFGVFFGTIALIIEPYRRGRLATFWDIFWNGPNATDQAAGGFQVFNGLVGFGSGGLAGNGYGESVIKQGYLNEAAYTDSIYAVLGDEFGLIGALLIIVAFLYFTSIGLDIAKNAKDSFSSLLAVGMTSLISIQAFLNIAAILVIIPFGGMPLPFFTYGGSSTLMTLAAVGVLLNVSKKSNQVK